MMKFFAIASHDSCAPVKNEDPASSISCIGLVKEGPMLTILRLDFLYVVFVDFVVWTTAGYNKNLARIGLAG